MRSYEQEMKRQSTECHTPNSLRAVKVRRAKVNIKMLMIFEHDIHGVLTSHKVPEGKTVNRKYYMNNSKNKLRLAICRKHPEHLAA